MLKYWVISPADHMSAVYAGPHPQIYWRCAFTACCVCIIIVSPNRLYVLRDANLILGLATRRRCWNSALSTMLKGRLLIRIHLVNAQLTSFIS